MNLRPYALQAKPAIVIMNCAPRWKFVRQRSPGTAGTVQIQDPVDDFSHIDLSRPTTWFSWRDIGFYELPLLIRQIAGIWFPFHILLYRPDTSIIITFHTRSDIPSSVVPRISTTSCPNRHNCSTVIRGMFSSTSTRMPVSLSLYRSDLFFCQRSSVVQTGENVCTL